jgi:predicted O-linked N-acetylglucosamine transferase (SPINDLY family)
MQCPPTKPGRNGRKFHLLPATFKIWMNILLQVEGSVLWLSNMNLTAQNNLRKEAEKKGVKGFRLIFADHLSNHDNHLARYQLADLFLDTFPYNAHTTALDALWSGLPLLTCTGKTFTSRVAASLLKAINMPELITHFSKDFESKAIEIASCPIKFEEIKNKLINNKYKEPLFNGDIFKDNFEAALKKMYLNYKLGLKPKSFEIQNK